MDKEQLIAFERAVRYRSFSAAARSLDISQPAMTARIQGLEQEVGGALFVRSGSKQLQLTERGASFYPYVSRILNLLNEGLEIANLAEAGQHGRLKIGVTESLAGDFLGATLQELYRTYPQVEYFVRTGHSNQIIEMLQDGIVHLGLLGWSFYNTQIEPLLTFREPLVLVVAAAHPLTQRSGQIPLVEIGEQLKPFFLVRWGWESLSLLPQFNFPDKHVLELPLDTVRYLLRQGTGGSILTRAVVADELRQGRLVELNIGAPPQLYRESALVKLAKTRLSATQSNFIEVLSRQVLQSDSQITVSRSASVSGE